MTNEDTERLNFQSISIRNEIDRLRDEEIKLDAKIKSGNISHRDVTRCLQNDLTAARGIRVALEMGAKVWDDNKGRG